MKKILILIIIVLLFFSCEYGKSQKICHVAKCYTSDSQIIFIEYKYIISFPRSSTYSEAIDEITIGIVNAEISSFLKDFCIDKRKNEISQPIKEFVFNDSVVSYINRFFAGELKIRRFAAAEKRLNT